MVARVTAGKIRGWLPKRSEDAHKGSCGRIYILAGSKGMAGAGVLAGLGAVSAGAGLVRLGTVKSQQSFAVKRAPLELTTDGLPENKSGQLDSEKIKRIEHFVERFDPDIVAVGPGLGVSGSTREVVTTFLRKGRRSFVLDADGLNILAEVWKKPNWAATPVVMTPHPGELARLLRCSTKKIQSNREWSVKEGARRFKCVCLLKGHGTLVSDGKTVWKNTTGNPAMASAGMGDVLTGIIAALWGQMPKKNLENGLKAAVLGAYLHGVAGDLAFKKWGGLSIQASRLAEFIPQAVQNIKRK